MRSNFRFSLLISLHIFFHSRIIRLKFSSAFFIFMRKNYYFDNKRTRWISLTFFKKLILYCTTMSNVNRVRMRKFYISLTYFFSAFSFADSEDNMGREKTIFIPLYHIYLFTNIQTFICGFASQMTTLNFEASWDLSTCGD